MAGPFSRLVTITRRGLSTSIARLDAAYDGPGKTTVSILNENKEKLMVDGYSQQGFILNNNMRVIGPMALFPDAVLQWNIKSTLSVDENAFVLFELLHPKPDIVFFGYGGKTQSLQSSGRASHEKYIKERNKMIQRVMMSMRRKKINVECLPTEDAISAYNFLVAEDRLVAATLIPPEEVLRSEQSYNEDMESKFLGGMEFGHSQGKFDATGFSKDDLDSLSQDLKDYQKTQADIKQWKMEEKDKLSEK